MSKILIAEDDKEINRLMGEFLSEQGYTCVSVNNGLDAVRVVRTESPDMMLLDLMLPLKSGDSVLNEIRTFTQMPVIVVSAKDTVQNKIELMRLGADDYITKPFDLDELLVRIEAVLRRCRIEETEEEKFLTFKNITIDTVSKKITVNGKEIILSSKEYGILEVLLQNQDKLFSKANLYESVWNEKYMNDDNIMKVHMSNIRSRLKEADPDTEYIETVWGMGYRLKK